MSVALAVLLSLVVANLREALPLQRSTSSAQEQQEKPESIVVTPELDPSELEALLSDSTPEGRVVRQVDAYRWALEKTRSLRAEHFEALKAQELGPETLGDIAADPSAWRARPFRARGWVREWKSCRSGDPGLDHDLMLLELECGGRAFFAVRGSLEDEFVDVPVEGSFLRADGIFVKIQKEELAEGWVESPLFIGPRAISSYPALGRVRELSPASFDLVRDDTIEEATGMPFEERWRLLAYARDVSEEAIDWSQAPLLDGAKLNDILADGDPWRGRPVRLTVSQILEIWDEDPGENPARLTHMCGGWLGSWNWKEPAMVVRFESPFERGRLERRDQVCARAFFLKNFAYESPRGTLAIAPFFIVQGLDAYQVPPKESPLQAIFAVLVASFVGIAVLAFVLLGRDRKRAEQLQDELLRRRRMRRLHNGQSQAT